MEETKIYLEIITSALTSLSILIGACWVFYRFVIQQERFSNINFTADINIIGKQDNYYVVELIANIENTGKAQHKMEKFTFNLNALNFDDKIENSELWGNQINFPRLLINGSFLPKDLRYFFIDPGTTAKYSFITNVPLDTSFLLLHSHFKYVNRKDFMHTAEKTIKL